MSNENNYYEEKISEIKELMAKDLNKADVLLDVELNMPYIPEKYETKFIALKEEIIFNQEDKIKNTTLSEEKLIEYLNSGDDIKEATAIDSLSKVNVRSIQEEVIKWINEYGSLKPIARAYIYEILVSQQINVELTFDEVQLNPTINKSILDDYQVGIALATFEGQVEESPHMLKPMIDEFRHYLLLSFPNLPKDGESFAKDFAQAFKGMFDESIELTKEQTAIQRVIKS